MSATSGAGAVTRAAYVIFAAGASWHGKNDRAWIAWNCEKRYGCFPPAVCSGRSHCKPLLSGVVRYATATENVDPGALDPGSVIVKAVPITGCGSLWSSKAASTPSTEHDSITRSRVSSTSVSAAASGPTVAVSTAVPPTDFFSKSTVRSKSQCVTFETG